MTTKTYTERIGYCAVDSGQILITDPSYVTDFVNNKMGDEGKGHYSWAGACATTLTEERAGQLGFINTGGEGAGIVSSTGYGDGFYPVYAHYVEDDTWGKRVARLEIIFIDEDEAN
jgi:hypothetical protein